jgi:hypothetical protein
MGGVRSVTDLLPPGACAGMCLPLWVTVREHGVPDARQANASCRTFLPDSRELRCAERCTRAF